MGVCTRISAVYTERKIIIIKKINIKKKKKADLVFIEEAAVKYWVLEYLSNGCKAQTTFSLQASLREKEGRLCCLQQEATRKWAPWRTSGGMN